MLSAVQLLKFKGSCVSPRSHSLLVDFNQIHVRNIFLFSFALCMARQLFGDKINCQLDRQGIGQVVLDTKCFINGTHTDLLEPQYATLPVLYHDYYQWVPIILLLMALSFYLPFRVWSRHVHNYMEELTTKIEDEESCDRIFHVITLSKGNNLYWKTWFLESVYALHLIIHIILLNQLFHRVLSLSGWSWSAIQLLFPEMAACFYDYFTGGTQTAGKFQCLMPLNNVYRKIFYVLYFLFCVLIPLHVTFFLYRMIWALRMGKNWVNMWWCIQISQQAAKKWQAYQKLSESWDSFRRIRSEEIQNVELKLQESNV